MTKCFENDLFTPNSNNISLTARKNSQKKSFSLEFADFSEFDIEISNKIKKGEIFDKNFFQSKNEIENNYQEENVNLLGKRSRKLSSIAIQSSQEPIHFSKKIKNDQHDNMQTERKKSYNSKHAGGSHNKFYRKIFWGLTIKFD